MKRFIPSARAAVICSVILAVGIPSVALGFGEGRSLIAGKRNPGYPNATSKETQIISNATTYGTRQSNIRNGDGGGAIYGCRSATGHEPCIRANNLNTGRAFEFATDGNQAGSITTKDATGAPFTTNATGVATGLNADRVDSHDASDFAMSADLLSAMVTVPASGAATVTGRGATAVATDGTAFTATVTFNRDVSKCAYTASPVGTATAVAPGVAAATGNVNAVTVNFNAGTTPALHSFHLQVIC